MRSVLDDLGQEVTGIVSPVSICMALTVALVRILNPEGNSDSNAVFLASAYYSEQEGDSTGQKLSGAVINSLIFIGVVAVMTFILVLLFKYGYVRIIYAYMGFAGFSIFFVLAGIIAIELLQTWHVHIDFISFTYILFNFAVVGSLTLFFLPAPLLMKQCYLILTGIVTAFVFTWIPEWTTWVLLVAMALYDVLAVLVPGGPLKMLVELAQEREETIPALVYEARPARRGDASQQSMQPVPAAAAAGMAAAGPAGVAAGAEGPRAQLQQELPARPAGAALSGIQRNSVASTASIGGSSSVEQDSSPETPLIPPALDGQQAVQASGASNTSRPRSPLGRAPLGSAEAGGAAAAVPAGVAAQHSGHGTAEAAAGVPVGTGRQQEQVHVQQQQHEQQQRDDDEDSAFNLPDSIKLGLGDFIFYSVLVGRAAMYDYLTVFSCYLAIVAGLGCTLLWLAMAHKALPALPISIALAVSFYFISRFVMEPVILPMTLELVYF